jgi:hypothetical protein
MQEIFGSLRDGRVTDDILVELDKIAARHRDTIQQLKFVNNKLKI